MAVHIFKQTYNETNKVHIQKKNTVKEKKKKTNANKKEGKQQSVDCLPDLGV